MKTPTAPCRTVLVDDHRVFAFALGKHIGAMPNFELSALASDGIEGLEKCSGLQPDLAILDVKIPKMDGLDLATILRQQFPGMRILILSAMLDPMTLDRARKIGVHGFVDKSQPFEIFEVALKAISEGGHYFSETFIDAEQAHHRSPRAYHKLLSPRQQLIVGLIGSGKSNRQIAEQLGLSIRTIESHRYRIIQILDLENPKELFRYAIENGFAV